MQDELSFQPASACAGLWLGIARPGLLLRVCAAISESWPQGSAQGRGVSIRFAIDREKLPRASESDTMRPMPAHIPTATAPFMNRAARRQRHLSRSW